MSNQSKLALAALFLSTSFLLACGSTESMRQAEAAGRTDCSFDFGSKTLRWRPVLNLKEIALSPQVGNTHLPSEFETYMIDGPDLDAFLKAAKAGQPAAHIIRLPLPEHAGCPLFKLSSSGTMTETLSQKFPDLISLKGLPEEHTAAALRLDYDGKKMEAEITWGGHIYYLSPWPGEDGIYYLLYKKEDAGFEKKPFPPR